MYGISTTLQKKLRCPFNSIYFDDSAPALTTFWAIHIFELLDEMLNDFS